MALSSSELMELADKRISQVQKSLNASAKQAPSVFHATYHTALMDALTSLQLYVDQWLLDPSFPWCRHWLERLTDVTDDSSLASPSPASPQQRAKHAKRDDAAKLTAFVHSAEKTIASGAAAGSGTLKQLELGVLYHVSMLMQKLLSGRPGFAESALLSESSLLNPQAAAEATTMDEAREPEDATLEAAAGASAPARDEQAKAATVPPLTLRQALASAKRRAPTYHSGGPAVNATPDALRTVIDGVEYTAVNMRIANTVCRPHSARNLTPRKHQNDKIPQMMTALSYAATDINAERGPTFGPPPAKSKLRANDTPPVRPWSADERDDGKPAQPVGPDYQNTPSIRRPTAPTVALGQSASSARGSSARYKSVRTDGAAMTQDPIGGIVQPVGETPSAAHVSCVPTRQWGMRHRGPALSPKRTQAASTQWILVSHDANQNHGVVRHSQTVAVTSSATRTEASTKLGGSWAPSKDASWIVPRMKDTPDTFQ
jgi:hypothetical protein